MELINYSLYHWRNALKTLEKAGAKTNHISANKSVYNYKNYSIELSGNKVTVYTKFNGEVFAVYERRDIFEQNQNMQMEFYLCPTLELKKQVRKDLFDLMKLRYKSINDAKRLINN